ncbi:MAG TPA: hypothetical protein VIF40_12090 [Methylosinus sp.]|jgi:hypothetical protein|uniref:P-loop ATPase, Sll1717 family n=1 Tax=Methylosinus sp. TaxID=427 RepID=UPI002F9360F2
MPVFSDAVIERLFGADDAENEDEARFLSYFYVVGAYNSLMAALPIRIVVGHKGVGKSALLKRAFLSDKASRKFSIWLQPGDLIDIKATAAQEKDFNIQIETWKSGISKEIAERLAEYLYGPKATEIFEKQKKGKTKEILKFISLCLGDRKEIDRINIYIDDIDRGWSASREDIRQISALLNAIRDISSPSNNANITFRIGLRSDVYFLVRTSDESTDKIDSNVIWLRWTNDDIIRLMARRIETFFDNNYEGKIKLSQQQITDTILSKVIEPIFSGSGHWEARPMHNVLLSLTRARPRDLVKLLRGGAKKAQLANAEIITTEHLKDFFEAYSQERLQDITNEFRGELPEIQRLIFEMRPLKKEHRTANSYQFSTDQLISKLGDVMRHVPLRFTNGWSVTPKSLIQFLYKIDFITARRETIEGIDRKYFEESRFLASEIVDFGYGWEIHPAYRWALQPQDINAVLDSLFGKK